jgi:hypothetical protein
MASVAARKLGDSKLWKSIQKLNPGLRDPNALIAGSTIKIPQTNVPPKAPISKPGPSKFKISGGRRGGI